jgi:hypothetical protein
MTIGLEEMRDISVEMSMVVHFSERINIMFVSSLADNLCREHAFNGKKPLI